ncbi:major facilitator superfamily domain-containing protein [Radiomyces spectabilis]|uniref:major facilitator superfamily domain-containing protein n=1 Tax=Radiomyces spectabilis TaxID=64574 RepID=UPI00221E7199|nr:major facilitator superfamily domain-containing protein [Radiomyces spectabilis]KAI8376205.1 major facilitator superfamily domain-containing protein [Radiomyces spectabilis]
MWLQAVAITLPRVQRHFDVSNQWIGILCSALFTGMTFGSFFWGTYSDSRGRKIPYTMTLLITSFFGILSSFAFSFWSLCVLLFFLGFGVGGNMPTDGALYLEFLPKEYHYLLTFMSVFFSFGAVLASVLGYIILPSTSCPEPSITDPNPACDVATQNIGWRILLFSVAVITMLMLAARSLWLKLPETPKYLLSKDRINETIIVLQDIARINGETVSIDRSDLPNGVQRDKSRLPPTEAAEEEAFLQVPHAEGGEEGLTHPQHRRWSSEYQNGGYNDHEPEDDDAVTDKMLSELYDTRSRNSLAILFSPKWRRTIILVWCIWTFTSVAFTMFNVLLPKYLETLGFEGEAAPTLKDVYWEYMIYSLAGVPGSVMASYMIETRLGRKGTMALSAFGSSLSLMIFSAIESRVTMLLSSSAVSFLATLLYAVIYGYTPEVFDTSVRGTAVGSASGLGRVAGIVSPVISGILLTIRPVLPLYVSVVGFSIVGICILLLPYETRGRPQED